MLEQNQKEI